MFLNLKNKFFLRIKDPRGVIAVIVAISLVALVGMVAYALDEGMLYEEKAQLQSVVDAAALAGAQDLPDTSEATNQANEYIQLNGYNPSDFEISFSDSNTIIYVSATNVVDYNFAGVFGLDTGNVYADAAAEKVNLGEAFNYALFSGSPSANLTLNGSNQYIGGSSHSNDDFIANGSNITITDACEAVGNITVNGSNINIDNRIPGADFIDMPDFSETIRIQAENAGTLYVGNKTYNGSSIEVNDPIYVEGNVTINGSHFVGKGCILATGNITFNGSNLNQSTDDAVLFYSKNGRITINGSGITLDGIVYAPSNRITMNGSNQTINGRVIGYRISINGSGLTVQSGTSELACLPNYIRLIE